MKKLFKLLPILALPLLAVSCSSDDDEPGGPVNIDNIKSSAIITTKDGEKVLVSKVGNVNIEYTENGMPTRIGDLYINYSKGTITDGYDYSYYDDDDVVFYFSMNSKGHITQLSIDVDYREGSEYVKGSAKVSFSYNGSDHLTKITVNSSSEESYYDSYYGNTYSKEEYKSTMNITWNGDNIKGSSYNTSWTENWKEDGESGTDRGQDHGTFTVEDDIDNPLGQYTLSIADMLDADFLDILYLAGLLGNASGNIPTNTVKEEVESGYEYSDYNSTTTKEWRYDFNSDGTIKNEKEVSYRGTTYNNYYSYITLGSRAGSEGFEGINFLTNDREKKEHKLRIGFRR